MAAWWAIALRGLAAIVLGIVILTAPRPTFALLVGLLGIYFFVDGLFSLVATFHAGAQGQNWWPYLLEGLLSIGVGLLAFARPGITAFLLLALVGIRSIVVGVAEIATGVGVLASLDIASVRCHPRPRVGVFSTGDELVEEGALGAGKIRDSNRPMLLAVLAESGFDAVDYGIVRDD